MLIKYAKWLVAQYYQTLGNTKLAILAQGAPGMPGWSEEDAAIVAKWWFDLIRPDYYGYARSDGFFSPKNCIQTAYDTIQTFRQMMPLLDCYNNTELLAPYYDEIVVIGGSFWWRIAAMMPKFDPSIQEIVLLYPRLAPDNMGLLGYPEESDEEFLRQYTFHKHIYRFADGMDPFEAMIDIGSLSPLVDYSHLQDTKVFIWHGTADDVIWSWRSQQFVDQLLAMNPAGEYKYAEYYGLDHGHLCKQAGLKGRLHWRKKFSELVS